MGRVRQGGFRIMGYIVVQKYLGYMVYQLNEEDVISDGIVVGVVRVEIFNKFLGGRRGWGEFDG